VFKRTMACAGTAVVGSQSDLSFPLKLHHIMETEPRVMKWNTDGKSFRIIDEDTLVERILHQHFRTSRFSSFTRNLNIYGFKKIAKGEFAGSYFHPRFSKGDIATIASMKRCPRKPAAGSDKGTKAKSRKPAAARTQECKDTSRSFSERPCLKVEPNEGDPVMPPPPPPQQQTFVNPFMAGDDDDIAMEGDISMDSSFLRGTSFGSEGEFNINPDHMDHELALPENNGSEIDVCFTGHQHFFQTPTTPCQSFDHFQNPFTDDDDLVEWKQVLSHCGGMDERECRPMGHARGHGVGPNAYCVNVPPGPLGVIIEKRGDKVCLSRFTNPSSPLSHVPVGSQLVNLDGRDTTKMVVCQITKLDKCVRHRSRMIIFMECPSENTQHLNQHPEVQQCPLPHQHQEQAPKEKFSDDVSMDSDSDPGDDPAAFIVLPATSTPISTWLSVSGMQSFCDAM